MNTITKKQCDYLASLINQWSEDYPTLKTIWEKTPKNNEKYPNKGGNYKMLILSNNLAGISSYNANYVISFLLEKTDKFGKNIKTKIAFEILFNQLDKKLC